MSEQQSPEISPELSGLNREQLDRLWNERGAVARRELPEEVVTRIEKSNVETFRLGTAGYVAYQNDPEDQVRVTNQDLWNALQRQKRGEKP